MRAAAVVCAGLATWLAALSAHAQTEAPQWTVELVGTPRAAAFVPFGIGQFANGDNRLGAVFLAAELVSLSAAVGTWAYIDARYPPVRDYHSDELATLRMVNLVAWAVLGLTSAVGVAQANVAYQPVRIVLRPVASVGWVPGGAVASLGVVF